MKRNISHREDNSIHQVSLPLASALFDDGIPIRTTEVGPLGRRRRVLLAREAQGLRLKLQPQPSPEPGVVGAFCSCQSTSSSSVSFLIW